MESRRLAYSPEVEPGTTKTADDGSLIEYVEPEEYFPALLAHRMNSTLVFIAAHSSGQVPEDRLASVDDAIARVYQEEHAECVLTPRVTRALAKVAVGPSGKLLLESLETVRQELYAAETLDGAIDLHGAFRLQILLQGAEGYFTDLQVAAGELLTDYLLVQRAIAEDIRRAERTRKAGETRGQLLAKWDRSAEVEFERVVGHVLRPQRLAEMIPQNKRNQVSEFAIRRKQTFREGVFVHTIGNIEEDEDDDALW